MSEWFSMTGAEFRTFRLEQLKLKQEELANLLDVSRQTVSAIEKKNGQIPKVYVLAVRALHSLPGALKRLNGG